VLSRRGTGKQLRGRRPGRPQRRQWRERPDSGQAMLIVLAMVAVLVTIPGVVLAATINQLPLTSQNLYWNAAYEAAQAGLNDYVQHLDADESFTAWSAGSQPCSTNPDPFSGTSSHSSDPFCGWVQVSSSPPEWYEYALPKTNGAVTLTVSGKAGTGPDVVVRTFVYKIAPQSSFLDNIYWTNYEYTDPDIQQGNCSSVNGDYYYPNGGSGCRIVFGPGDVVNGPAFSNDTLSICDSGGSGPHFEGTVYDAAWTRGEPLDVGSNGGGCDGSTSAAQFPSSAFPARAQSEPLPTTSADEAAAKQVGCYISGSGGSAANVSVTLTAYPATSPTTTEISWTGGSVQNSSTNPNTCDPNGTYANQLKSALIYVNGDVTINGGSTEAGFLTIVAGDDGSPPAGIRPGNETDSSAAGDITVAGNIEYPSSHIEGAATCGAPTPCDPDDALGLIGAYFVRVAPGLSNVTIDAAILALGGSFYVEGWSEHGFEGTLSVFGSIAQDFRGPVGLVGGTGYIKNYIYDSALVTLWPPYYLSATSATWSPTSYAEERPGCASRALPLVAC